MFLVCLVVCVCLCCVIKFCVDVFLWFVDYFWLWLLWGGFGCFLVG